MAGLWQSHAWTQVFWFQSPCSGFDISIKYLVILKQVFTFSLCAPRSVLLSHPALGPRELGCTNFISLISCPLVSSRSNGREIEEWPLRLLGLHSFLRRGSCWSVSLTLPGLMFQNRSLSLSSSLGSWCWPPRCFTIPFCYFSLHPYLCEKWFCQFILLLVVLRVLVASHPFRFVVFSFLF